MGQTKYFNLAFFDFGDNLSSPINVQKEIDRFVVIDKQLYGMYNIFGNGVIEGFNVTDAGFQESKGISVNISEGLGIINFLAVQTQIPGQVTGLPPNSIINIYATVVGSTYLDRTVIFQYSTGPVANAIKLAMISTGSNNVIFIDNNIRDLIGFEQIIQDAIDDHRHRGTPTKIDLKEEVKNQLPGARLEGIDASKVTSGRFDIDRIPLVDHNNLEHNGMLNHAALDSFVRTFSQNNRELLGEINSVNLLKSILFWKTKFEDVDEYFINELALIPGISPNSFIDFNASTANINLSDGCISGIPSKAGIFTSVYWNDTFSFNTNTFNNNILIDNDTVFIDASDSATESIADFSSGVMPFEEEMIIIDNNQQAVITTEDGNRIGKLGGGGVLNYFYRINYNTGKNWVGSYDELVIKVKTTEEIHGPVYMYVVNGSNVNSDGQFGSLEVGDIDGTRKPSVSWEILAKDENSSTLVEKVFDITNLELDDVTQITIFTKDSFTFEIDDLAVRRTNIVSKTGTIRFKYLTETSLTFHSIFYNASTPSGTSISLRLKAASSSDLLSRAFYTLSVHSGDVIALNGSAIEIEVVMTSDESRTVTPVLNSIELRLLTDATFTGFEIDTESEFERGTLSNLDINPAVKVDQSILNISTPINVGGRYFAKSGSVSENNDSNVAVYGFSGSLMPISPNQAREWSRSSSRGFKTVTSVVRRFDNTFLIADMENNRILQVDRNGNLLKGFGSTYSIDTNFYPLSAVYNSTDKILAIAFTKAVVVEDITKISFFVGSSQVVLTSEDTILNNNKSGNKILEIQLDDDSSVRLLSATSDNLTIDFAEGAFTEVIIVNEGMKVVGNSIFSPLKGLACFVGDFTFIDNIRHPIFIYENSENNWMYGNSSIFYVDNPNEEEITVADVVEIDPNDITNTEGKLISSSVTFSDYTLGGIYEYDSEGRFVVAGIEQSSTTLQSGVTGDDILSGFDGDPPEDVKFRAKGVDDLKNYMGRIFVLDKINNKQQILYSSPDGLFASSVDGFSNGNLLVGETALASSAGRLVIIDAFGSVVWQYGQGTFHIINSAKVINNDNLIISV